MALREADLRQLEADRATEAEVFEFPTSSVSARVARGRHTTFVLRRVAVATMAVAVLALGMGWARGALDPAPVESRPGSPAAVKLQAGATLWEVAQEHAAPGTDRRAYIDQIVELNRLVGAPQAGARIKLP